MSEDLQPVRVWVVQPDRPAARAKEDPLRGIRSLRKELVSEISTLKRENSNCRIIGAHKQGEVLVGRNKGRGQRKSEVERIADARCARNPQHRPDALNRRVKNVGFGRCTELGLRRGFPCRDIAGLEGRSKEKKRNE